ncbi:MAG TPA: PspC family transcriptional regulator [Bacteroides sp.]|nr:PspC domain-containing protein [Phocaeicola coprophilus]HBB07126.1 PspC family transcriptional regulator [Bacteroides sp.]
MGNKRLTRSKSDCKIAGVCAGLAQYFGLDTTLVRLVYALLTLFTAFCGVVVYIIMWLVVPQDN